jgi:hypothetical protein
MKKLELRIEDLRVDSFETDARERSRGTIRGFDSNSTTGNQIICECTYDVGTCDLTCGQTCGCGTGSGTDTADATCATGNQIQCGC